MAGSDSLIAKEFLLQPRRKYFYLKRCGMIGLGSLVLLIGMISAMNGGGAATGLAIYSAIAYGLLFASSFMAPISGAQVVFSEKQHKTLGLLYLTDLHNRHIVWGKFCSTLLTVGIVLAAALPLFFWSVTLGGIAAPQVAAGLALITGNLVLGTSLGLTLGTKAPSERRLNREMMTWVFLLHLVLPFGLNVLADLGLAFAASALPLCSSFYAMHLVLLGNEMPTALTNLAWSFGLGALLLLWVWTALPRQTRDEAPSVRRRGLLGWINQGRSLSAIPALGKRNPVFWKDLHFIYGGSTRVVLLMLFLLALGAAVAAAYVVWLKVPLATVLSVYFGCTSFGAFAVFNLLSLVRACRAFNAEKESGAMQVLLTSAMPTHNIVRGKCSAILRIGLPWALLGTLTLLPFLLAMNSAGNDSRPLLMLFTVLSSILVGVPIALWTSLSFNTAITFIITVLLQLCWSYLRAVLLLPVLVIAGIILNQVFHQETLIFLCAILTMLIIDALMALGILRVFSSVFRISAARRLSP